MNSHRTGSGIHVRVVECAGPPGSGKSTITRALERSLAAARRARPATGTRARALLTMLGVAPAVFGQVGPRPGMLRKRLMLIAYLEALRDEHRRVVRGGNGVLLLDQGPVYCLQLLERSLRASGNDRRFARYCEDQREYWRSALDLIVLCDAPADVLHARVIARRSTHGLLGADTNEAERYVEAARQDLDRMLEALAVGDGPMLVRLDTSLTTIDEAVDRIAELVTGRSAALGSGSPPRAGTGVA